MWTIIWKKIYNWKRTISFALYPQEEINCTLIKPMKVSVSKPWSCMQILDKSQLCLYYTTSSEPQTENS